MFNEPLIDNEPVNSWKSSEVLPNLVEPLSYNTDELTTEMFTKSAVKVPCTVKLFSISAEPDTMSPFLILNSFAIIY
jgi:hypothetical protein